MFKFESIPCVVDKMDQSFVIVTFMDSKKHRKTMKFPKEKMGVKQLRVNKQLLFNVLYTDNKVRCWFEEQNDTFYVSPEEWEKGVQQILEDLR